MRKGEMTPEEKRAFRAGCVYMEKKMRKEYNKAIEDMSWMRVVERNSFVLKQDGYDDVKKLYYKAKDRYNRRTGK